VSSFPLGEIIQCREASGRIAKWAVEIMGEAISFAPRKAIKSQVLADFVAEWVDTQLPTAPIQPELWTMFFDGSLMKTGAGAGLLFISPLGKHLRYVLHLHFPASNNVAEYEALVNGLRIAIELGVRRLDARGDSVKTDGVPEPEKASAQPEAPSAQPEAPSAQPEAPSAQPESPSAPRVRHCALRRSRAGSRLIEIGRPRTCNISTEESYPSTELKLGGWRGTPSHSSCWETGRSSTTAAPRASSSDAFPSPKARSSYKRYTRGLVAITQRLEPLLETPFDKVSTGRPRWPTPLELSAPAKGVNSMRGKHTCPLRPCRRYPSPGRLLCGGWTSSAPCRRHLGATRTCWSPSTNSPSGSRSDP
jgi:hypothetical protein